MRNRYPASFSHVIDGSEVARAASYASVRKLPQQIITTLQTLELDPSNGPILELGTGPRLDYGDAFPHATGPVIALDRHFPALVYLPSHSAKRVCADMLKAPFCPGYFEIALSISTLHYFSTDELTSLFAKVKILLRWDGRAYFVTQTREQIQGRFENSFFPELARESWRFHRQWTLEKTCRSVGFGAVRFLPVQASIPVDATYRRLIEERHISGLATLNDDDFQRGVAKWRTAISDLESFEARFTVVHLRH